MATRAARRTRRHARGSASHGLGRQDRRLPLLDSQAESDWSIARPSPLFPLPPKRRLSIDDLHAIYAVTDWSPIIFLHSGTGIAQPPVAMLKALVLPYLLRIPSEAALARDLQEQEDLAALCGFPARRTPTRAMLWHFRHNVSSLDSILTYTLTLMAAGSEQLDINVP